MVIIIRPGRAPSVTNVAIDIGKALSRTGVKVVVERYLDFTKIRRLGAQAVIVVTAVEPTNTHSLASALTYIEGRMHVPTLWYATVEGYPRRELINWRLFSSIRFVANSLYTHSRLTSAGLNVIDVIPHGVDLEFGRRLLPIRVCRPENKVKQRPLILGIVASAHRRKGWVELIQAIERTSAVARGTVKFLYIAPPSVDTLIKKSKVRNLFHKFGSMGSLTREQVFTLYCLSHVLVVGSLAEGFGLPPLEAMSLKTPVIVARHRPFTEFIPKSAYWVSVHEKRIYKDTSGIAYELFLYRPEDMASAIDEAIDEIENSPSRYVERAEEAYENARRYDIYRLYPRFLSLLQAEK